MSTDANPDLPTQRFVMDGGRRRLVTDEQEWLARPNMWALDLLDHDTRCAKQKQLTAELYRRVAGVVACPSCRPDVTALLTEECADKVPGNPTLQPGWYDATHPAGRCDAWHLVRYAWLYNRGGLTAQEFTNKIVDEFVNHTPHIDHGLVGVRRGLWWQWCHELASELLGPNPFRPTAFDPSWQTEAVVGLARRMYERRDFAPMPVLADALEDAGCADADVLSHCRGPGPHVRGCWVVDLALGKG